MNTSHSLRKDAKPIANLTIFMPISASGGKILFKENSLNTFRLLANRKRGLFEFDDVIHNTLGCMIGYAMACGVRRVIKGFNKKNNIFKYGKKENLPLSGSHER